MYRGHCSHDMIGNNMNLDRETLMFVSNIVGKFSPGNLNTVEHSVYCQ